tara:strand:- start:996 stop:1199 length:204 start_codon:yes stop_codon:yes gene_type:complete
MNNADSFAISFDNIWKNNISTLKDEELDLEQKINLALSKISDHPFLVNNPSKAREVAEFRIRLLKLR